MIASTSSDELKNGNRLDRMVSNITPADHMSISIPVREERKKERNLQRLARVFLLFVCCVHLKRTSGARNPRVPARFARLAALQVAFFSLEKQTRALYLKTYR